MMIKIKGWQNASVSPQNLHRSKQRKRLRKLLPKANFGRSDRIRTCGIDVPNVARYQLRHTPKNIKFQLAVVRCASRCNGDSVVASNACLPIAALLPLLIPRCITHRVRSEMSPTAPHPEKY